MQYQNSWKRVFTQNVHYKQTHHDNSKGLKVTRKDKLLCLIRDQFGKKYLSTASSLTEVKAACQLSPILINGVVYDLSFSLRLQASNKTRNDPLEQKGPKCEKRVF